MLPGDRLLCASVEQLDEGDQFTNWPLHVTVVPWFRLDIGNQDLVNELKAVLEGVRPFQVTIGDEARLGRGKTANLVRQPTTFMEVEKDLRELLKLHNAWIVDKSTKQREYKPHVTAQKEERLYVGDVFVCNSFYLVEQMGNYKLVAAKLILGE